ncbi:glycosyltransferase [Gloeobacter kilaueensis]|uniref:Glycosyl transferase group 1 n=1 Tax=Gloeobacter kilaueensis (strain ATCC BAA-2537 / CCAP 1431/1 / ULC 316 / JS1) TaxID=1183438 RepID=U5QLQ0_GLOK1|nr:glycosyltransferase [Gloeobacter kilaueensis]AGY58544.1 glycosyl transferase group 1 [Gloeobacter kilaueensis JS1]
MKVALVHDYLIKHGGSENVLEALLQLFPDVPIYTSYYSAETLPACWRSRDIRTSFLQKIPLGKTANYQQRLQYLLPLLPVAFENFDLREYDLVISSAHAFAKGVLTRQDALHVSYMHTPTRYLWDMTWEYQRNFRKPLLGSLMPPVLSLLRTWDYQAAQRPDYLIANSRYIQQRIAKFYRRSSTLVYPPVDTKFFVPAATPSLDYYLVAGRFVPYKRLDLAVEAFNRLGLPLWVVGEGPELERLRSVARQNIVFYPHQPRAQLAEFFANCRALIFPGEEDFGILPVEVQACGRPVIAFGRGGATETVVPDETGVLFSEQSVESLMSAVWRAEQRDWSSRIIRAHAEGFSQERFLESVRGCIERALRGDLNF